MGAVGGFQVLPLLVVFGLLPAPFLFGEGALGFSVDLDAPACPFQVIAAQLRGFLRDFFFAVDFFLLRGVGDFPGLFIHIDDAFDHLFHNCHPFRRHKRT